MDHWFKYEIYMNVCYKLIIYMYNINHNFLSFRFDSDFIEEI